MAEVEICALCYETLPASEPSLDTITTQCCQEPICHSCATLTNPITANFTCANCSAPTSIVTKPFTDVITATLTNIRDNYDHVLANNQSQLVEITIRRSQVEQLVEQLDLNLTAVVGSATNSVGQFYQLDQAVLATAIPQHRQAYSKVIDLARAELKQSYQQNLASLKYLTKLGRTLTRLENTSVSQLTSNQADLTSLLRLSYDVMVLTTSKAVSIPIVPLYQPMRLFNHRFVLDDVSEQFSAAAKNKPRHRMVHTRIIEILADQFGLDGAQVTLLVELPGESATGSSSEPSQPPHLTCYVSDFAKGFALVDQAGQVVYYRPDTILAVNSTWIVSLVTELNLIPGTSQPDNYFIEIKNLSQLLQQPQWYRFGREAGLESLSALTILKISLEQASFRPRQPLVEIRDDDLLIFYQRIASGWRFQRWRLDTAATLSQQLDLPLDQEIYSFYNNTVAVDIRQQNGRKRSYCVSLSNLLDSLESMNRGEHLDVSLLYPIGPDAGRVHFRDGSVVIDDENLRIWRPDGVIQIDRTRGKFHQYNTTPWDGRLYRMTTINDDESGYDSGSDNSDNDSLSNGTTFVIEFY